MKKRHISLVAFLCIFIGILSAQNTRLISGIIYDDTDIGGGYPLPGANVVIKGTALGTTTDIDGYFELEVPVGSTIVISSVGLITREFVVGASDGVDPKTLKKGTPPKKEEAIAKEVASEPKVYWHKIPDDPNKTFSPYFFVHSDSPSIDRFPLKSSHAEVNVAGVIADVTITQTYVNEGNNTLEAEYIFPGSINAAVYGMDMKIGNRLLKAVIKKKQEAKQIYETAKAEGRTASLLDQERPNVFKMSVANILPGDTIEVRISYTEMLNAKNGIYEFAYPTVVGPRFAEDRLANIENKSPDWNNNPYITNSEDTEVIDFSMDINLNSPIPIQQLRSPSHKINVDYISATRAHIALEDEKGDEGNRDFVLNYMLRGGEVQSGLLTFEGADENFFAYILEPPAKVADEQISLREYIFVIDVSGSMSGTPMEISKNIMRNIFESLKPYEKFNILFFSGGSSWFAKESVFATEENKARAIQLVNFQYGGGNTQLLSALQNALDLKKEPFFSRSFVVLTDGYVSVESQAYCFIRDNLDKANLFSVGIGSSVNRHIIDGMAHAGKAEPFYVLNFSESKAQADEIAEAIKRPVLSDVELNFEGVEVYDVEPRKIPDLFSERTMVVFGKYKKNNSGKLTVTGKAGNKDYMQVSYFDSVETAQNSALKYLWARNKIKYYDDYAAYYEPHSYEKQGIITDLGLQYNLLTQYTSFVAEDSVVRVVKPVNSNNKVRQPLPLPQYTHKGALSGSQMGFSMKEDDVLIDEVVAIGYGTQRAEDLTISATVLGSDEFHNKPVIGVSQALQGKAAGVQVTANSGSPGANMSVRIRGGGTIANADPLYVVDGIPVGNTVNINPIDIKSISILKDASATAMYGSRGANGVVIITTKAPKVGLEGKVQSETEFNTSYGISESSSSLLNNSSISSLNNGSFFKNDLSYSNVGMHHSISCNGMLNNTTGVLPNSEGQDYYLKLQQNYTWDKLTMHVAARLVSAKSINMQNNQYIAPQYFVLYANENAEVENSKFDNGEKACVGGIGFELAKGVSLKNDFSLLSKNNNWGFMNNVNKEEYKSLRNVATLSIEKKIYNADSTELVFSANSATSYTFEKEILLFKQDSEDKLQRENNYVSERITFDIKQIFSATATYGVRNYNADLIPDFAASCALKVQNLRVYKDQRFLRDINEMKFRLQYGNTHSYKQMENLYATFGLPTIPYVWNNTLSLPISTNGFTSLALTNNREISAGIDIAILKNKMLITAEMYRQSLTNNIAPMFENSEYAYRNAFDSRNKGVELSTTYRKLEGKFHYSVNANLTAMKTIVTNVYEGDELVIASFRDAEILAKEGEEYGTIYSNANGNKTKIGKANPDYELGVNTSFDFKGFDFSADFIYSMGSSMVNYTKAFMDNNTLNGITADRAVTDNSYLLANTISFGYSLPHRVVKKLHLKKLHFGIFVDKPFVLSTNSDTAIYGNITSQNNGQGIDFFGSPMERMFGGSLQIKF